LLALSERFRADCAQQAPCALSGQSSKELGYHSAYNAGGFKELADAGFETEPG
jgi:hypothetical protein